MVSASVSIDSFFDKCVLGVYELHNFLQVSKRVKDSD